MARVVLGQPVLYTAGLMIDVVQALPAEISVGTDASAPLSQRGVWMLYASDRQIVMVC